MNAKQRRAQQRKVNGLLLHIITMMKKSIVEDDFNRESFVRCVEQWEKENLK